MKKIRIEQVEPRFAQELETPLKTTLKKLGYAIPESFRLRVSLLQANGRKKRSNAGADTWAPESERMEFWLEPATPEKTVLPTKLSHQAEALPPRIPAARRFTSIPPRRSYSGPWTMRSPPRAGTSFH